MNAQTSVILNSLKRSPLLVGDVLSADVFERNLLGDPDEGMALDYEQKLGHLYEDALERLIDSAPSLDRIASNLQIFDENRRTIGELDFVVRDKQSGHYIHLELAVKFYLAIKRDDGWKCPGPNARDNWQAKLDRMRDHQFQLTRRAEARALLKDKFGITDITVQHLIYGCLFLPIGCDEWPAPDAISGNARIGRWLYVSQWDDYLSHIHDAFIIPKPLWPVEISDDVRPLLTPVTVEELKQAAQERCTMFTIAGSHDVWFLAPDDWAREES